MESAGRERPMNENALQNFKIRRQDYASLIDESLFIIRKIEEVEGIKIHSIEHRLKSDDSIKKKLGHQKKQR